MKKFLFLGFTIVFSNVITGQTNLFEHPDFDEIAENHKIIGVIPFEASVTLRPKHMKDISPEKLKRMEESEGESIQMAMHSWFLQRKKRGTLKVDVQSPYTTNAKLKKAGVTFENYDTFTPLELAKILKVDAIIMGTFETNKPMSEEASVVVGLLVGFWGPTHSATINLNIYNAQDGELLVNYNKKVRGSLGSDNDQLVNRVMRKASRRIAYTK
ncbi:hypothetical protein J4E06_12055 [Muricauda sp. NFXS6]|uniref:hypothetical protein n=1 Tax=Allomuricauda sp. NFXS6 TaxID=2819094 RepID=UPI0032DF8A73